MNSDRGKLFCTLLATAFGLTSCGSAPRGTIAMPLQALFTVTAANERSVVRAITHASECPEIVWGDGARAAMRVRAQPATVPLRGDSAQSDAKPAVFDVLTCEADWVTGAPSATVAGQSVPAPRKDIRRIVLIADTGCRMKASEKAFQACNDKALWPFADVARSAAALKPDLVVHIGDIHYRESPCPAGNKDCAGSPWGYGFDAWRADLFVPAAPLLSAAPWVFVRGNHESCFRAGQGWFRFIDAAPLVAERTCDSTALDAIADFSDPYAVPVGHGNQFIIFDSSKSSGKTYALTDPAYLNYVAQMQKVATLADAAQHSFFLSHHPLLAFAPGKRNAEAKAGGSQGLQSAFASVHPQRLFPDKVSVLMHGHIHLFEAISFATAHPASLVLGNSGSANEGRAPESIASGTEAFPGALVDDYIARSEYGFATLDKVDDGSASHWKLTEYDTQGKAVISCDIRNAKTRCGAPN
jgi:hypothetical protein